MAYGIKETKELLDLGFSVAGAIKSSMADGKIGLEDLGQMMLVIPKLSPAFTNIALVPKELGDLDASEQKELLDYAAQKLGELGEGKLVLIVTASLKLGLAALELYVAVK